MSDTRERPPKAPAEDEGDKDAPGLQRQARGGAAGRAGGDEGLRRKRSTEGASSDREAVMAGSDVATVERVIRRATKLQIARSGKGAVDEEGGLTDADVLRIGEELGLEEENVRQALREIRTERVRPKVKAEEGLAASLLGGRYVRASVTVSRRVHGGAKGIGGAEETEAARASDGPLHKDVQRLLETHLADRECLAEVRRGPGASVWVPATGLATKIQRGLNLGRRAYILAKAQEMILSVVAVDEDTSLVTLTADIGNLRRERATGWSIGSAVLMTPVGTALLALLGIPLEFAILAAAAGAGATAISATRVAVRKQRAQMRAAIHGLLERLKAGAPLEEPRSTFQERFLR